MNQREIKLLENIKQGVVSTNTEKAKEILEKADLVKLLELTPYLNKFCPWIRYKIEGNIMKSFPIMDLTKEDKWIKQLIYSNQEKTEHLISCLRGEIKKLKGQIKNHNHLDKKVVLPI